MNTEYKNSLILVVVLLVLLFLAGYVYDKANNLSDVETATSTPEEVEVTLTGKAWNWIRTDDAGKAIIPKVDKFNLTFKEDSTFTLTTDCNNGGGKYVVQGSEIAFKDVFATKMYCEGSQEAEFVKFLNDTKGFAIMDNQLILTLKDDTSKVYLK